MSWNGLEGLARRRASDRGMVVWPLPVLARLDASACIWRCVSRRDGVDDATALSLPRPSSLLLQ